MFGFIDTDIILKICFLIIDVFYILFLFVVLNRVLSMSRVIREVHDVLILKFIVTVNIIFAVSLFLLSLAIL